MGREIDPSPAFREAEREVHVQMSNEGTVLFDFGDCHYKKSFHGNIKEFLEFKGRPVDLGVISTACWFIPLLDGSHLHVYADDIDELNASCDQCRIIGA